MNAGVCRSGFLAVTCLFFIIMANAGLASAVEYITSCTVIDSPGTYRVIGTLYSKYGDDACIWITSDDVILDGNGHSVVKQYLTGTYAVYIYNSTKGLTNITVKDLRVIDQHWKYAIYYKNVRNGTIQGNELNGNRYGIYLQSSEGITVVGNNVRSNSGAGIVLNDSTGNSVINNDARWNDRYGVHLSGSDGNTVSSNDVSSNNRYGIFLLSSNMNRITNNYASWNDDVFDGRGIYLSSSNHNVLENNQINNNWYGMHLYFSNGNSILSNEVSSNYRHGIYLQNSDNNTLSENEVLRHPVTDGIRLYASKNNTLTRNTISINKDGVHLISSKVNRIYGNLISKNFETGLKIDSSSRNNVSDNRFMRDSHSIYLSGSSNNTVRNNTINGSGSALYLSGSTENRLIQNNLSRNNYGVHMWNSDDNHVTDNRIDGNKWGISLRFYSERNEIEGNSISNSIYVGVVLSFSFYNSIHNNHFNNTDNFIIYPVTNKNYWNTTKTLSTNIVGGPYIGGNYWGKPDKTGFSDTCSDTNSDGICDSSYTLATNNVDHLPLTRTSASTSIPEFPGFSVVFVVIGILALVFRVRK